MPFKSIYLCLLLLLFSTPAFSQAEPAAKILWQNDYRSALREAQKSGKPVLIDFNADWCPPCRVMDKVFWSRPEIVALSEEFVSVKVDYDLDRETVALFRVKSIPHIVVADPWGNMLNFHHGYARGKSENAIHLAMKTVQKDFTEIKEPNLQLEKNKDDALALIKIGEFYRKTNQLFLSNKYFKQALATKQLKTYAALRENTLVAAAQNYLKMRDNDEAERIFNESLQEFPNGANNETAFLGLVMINIYRKRFPEAETVFAQMKAKFPDSEITQQAAQNLQEAKTQTN